MTTVAEPASSNRKTRPYRAVTAARGLLWGMTGAALAACTRNRPTSSPAPSGSTIVAADTAERAAPPPNGARSAATLSQAVTNDGVGPITASTAAQALEGLFPGLVATVEHHEAEDHSYDITSFATGERIQVLDVVVDNTLGSNHVFRVDVYGSSFVTNDGIHVGSTVADFVAKDEAVTCRREAYTSNPENFTTALFCTSPRLPNLAFYLDDAVPPTANGKVPLAKVAALKFVRIIWKNPK